MSKTSAEPMSTYLPKFKMWEYFRLAKPRATLQHRTLPGTVPPPTNPSSSQDNNEQVNEDSKGHINVYRLSTTTSWLVCFRKQCCIREPTCSQNSPKSRRQHSSTNFNHAKDICFLHHTDKLDWLPEDAARTARKPTDKRRQCSSRSAATDWHRNPRDQADAGVQYSPFLL